MSIEQIELLTKHHADDRALLAERVQSLDDELQAIKRRRIPGIKSALSAAKDSRLTLHAAIDAERALFVSPRSRVFHGIKVGLQKGRGKLTFALKADKVVELIKKHFADKVDVLLKKKEEPIKDALLNLKADELKKIGGTVSGTGDVVLIKPADSEIDKLVEALLNGDAPDEAQDDAA